MVGARVHPPHRRLLKRLTPASQTDHPDAQRWTVEMFGCRWYAIRAGPQRLSTFSPSTRRSVRIRLRCGQVRGGLLRTSSPARLACPQRRRRPHAAQHTSQPPQLPQLSHGARGRLPCSTGRSRRGDRRRPARYPPGRRRHQGLSQKLPHPGHLRGPARQGHAAELFQRRARHAPARQAANRPLRGRGSAGPRLSVLGGREATMPTRRPITDAATCTSAARSSSFRVAHRIRILWIGSTQ